MIYSYRLVGRHNHNPPPTKNSIATTIFTTRQIFIVSIDVLAPVNRVITARITSIKADILYRLMERELLEPPKTVIRRTNRPIDQSVRPSEIQVWVMSRLLAVEMGPKPATTFLVGTMRATPQMLINTEPTYSTAWFMMEILSL